MFNPLIDRSMKAVGHLLSKSKDMVEGGLQVSTLCKLFTSVISPCLLYGSQIWGICPKIKLIEKVLVMFGKRILNASIIGVLGELNFFPLELSAKLNVVKYWYRLASVKAPPLAIDAYKLSMKLFHDDHHSWYKSLRPVMSAHDLEQAMLWPDVAMCIFSTVVQEYFMTEWGLDLSRPLAKKGDGENKLRTYCLFKDS